MFSFFLLVLLITPKTIFSLWDRDITCPKFCTCRLEHLTEVAIYRFIQNNNNEIKSEVEDIENNEVYYEDIYDKILPEENVMIRSITCMLLTDFQPSDILQMLPADVQSVTLIQGSGSGRKIFKFSDLERLPAVISLELLGEGNGSFEIEIDKAVGNLKYLNLERVVLKNSKNQVQKLINAINGEGVVFEYVQRYNTEAHPLTLVQKSSKDEILPYSKFIQRSENQEVPVFVGFEQLSLLRVFNCELNNVEWQMFDGLQKLKYLILEKNNLRFIPDFAFYGTPNLKSLSLAHNSLLSIQITDLAGLLELEYLDLSHNNFSQLSELSLPPFPKLKLANFADNPISVIYPNTFEVMNTTDSLVFGGANTSLQLLPNSFAGLDLLKKLTIKYMNVPLLKRDLLIGMPNLKTLILSGNISEIEYDAFVEVHNLETLVLSNSNIRNTSMDSFIGLQRLVHLDLSRNQLSYLPPGVFDPLTNLRELYLQSNKFKSLPKDIFSKIHPKLIRLNDNPWHCTCEMSSWKPMLVNRVKQKSIASCDMTYDKAPCVQESTFAIKYVYNNKVAPKCATPETYANWIVFHVMRFQLKCPEFKPKLKKIVKHGKVTSVSTTTEISTTVERYDEPEFNELQPMGASFDEFKDLKSVYNLRDGKNGGRIDFGTSKGKKVKKVKKFKV